MKISTYWLKDYIKIRCSLEEIADRLTMAGLEVKAIETAKDGLLFETEITSNRPDWLSYIGVAREISALSGAPLQIPKLSKIAKQQNFPKEFLIEIKDFDLCPYYTGTILKGIKPIPTPDFMKKRLEAAGMRPINFLVDVTNFVLLECGQPLHAFDLNLIQNNQIIIRRAKKEEKILAIDGKTYDLDINDLVIADGTRPVALAGVMGGKESEVSEVTQDILLESAYFNPASVRRTSKKFTLSTDSSYRFERGVDPEGVMWARDRVISLILEHREVGEISRVKTVGKKPLRRKSLLLTYKKMNNLLGSVIPPADVQKIFKNLELKIIEKNKKAIKVAIPSFRSDLSQAVDLIEEAARIYGFGRIPETLPTLITLENTISVKPKFEVIDQISNFLAGDGFYEVQNYSIIKGDVYDIYFPSQSNLVKIYNPQNKELNLMRPTLIPGLIETAQRNQYRGNKYFKFFEIGRIYERDGKKLPRESTSLGFVAYCKQEKKWSCISKPINLFNLKGTIESLLESLGVTSYEWKKSKSIWLEEENTLALIVNGKEVGALGEIQGEVLKKMDMEGPVTASEINLESIIALSTKERRFQPFSKYPGAVRDLSLLVPKELEVASVFETIYKEGNELLKNVTLFDIYEGKNIPAGVKSLAFSLEYQSLERTLESEEVQREHMRIAAVLQEKYNAQLPTAKQ